MPRRQAATAASGYGDSYTGHLPPTPPPIDVSKLNPADMVSRSDAGEVILIALVTDPDGQETTQVFHQTELTVGRDVDNDLCLPDDSVSRCHAMLTVNEVGDCMIIDLGSTNGTQVNRETIGREPTTITEDDFVAVGAYAVRVRTLGGEAATRMAGIEDEATIAGPTSPNHPVALHDAARMALAAQRDQSASYPPDVNATTHPPQAHATTHPPQPSHPPQPPPPVEQAPTGPPVERAPIAPPVERAPIAPPVAQAQVAPSTPRGHVVPSTQVMNQEVAENLSQSAVTAPISEPAISSVAPQAQVPKRTAQIDDNTTAGDDEDDDPPTGLATHELTSAAMQEAVKLQSQRREQALCDLVQAVIDEVGDSGQNACAESLERQAARIAARLDGGEAIVGAILEQARSELLDWGPLGSWLEGAEVQKVRIRQRRVWVDDGDGWRDTETQYSCEDAVAHTAERLREEEFGDGEIMRGWRLHVLDGRMSPRGYVVELQRVHLPQPLETWVKNEGMSADMQNLLEKAVQESENILLVGDGFELAGSLAEVAASDERVWVGPQAVDDLGATVLRPPPDARADAVAALAEMSYQHVFLPDGGLDAWPAMIDAVCMGMRGLVTTWPARTLELALSRAISYLAAVRGCPLEVARGLVLSSFAYAVEVENEPRRCVKRIARLEANGTVTDLFRHRDGKFEAVS